MAIMATHCLPLNEDVTNPSEVTRRVNEGFVPFISQIQGFMDYHWVNTRGGVMVSASVFQSQADAEESSKRAADWVHRNLAPLLLYAHQSCSYFPAQSSLAWVYA